MSRRSFHISGFFNITELYRKICKIYLTDISECISDKDSDKDTHRRYMVNLIFLIKAFFSEEESSNDMLKVKNSQGDSFLFL